MHLKAIIFSLAAVIIAGCTAPTLPNGKYETSLESRDDFIAIYDNMIIMRLRNPEKISGTEDGYWDWGGKFKILEDNKIVLNMDRQTARQWDFYYEFRKSGNGIKVNDLRAENSFILNYVPPRPKALNPAAPADSPAADYPAFN